MIRHLLRIVWNRRRANALVALEILLSFLVLCAVATMLVYYVGNYRRPLGYVWQDVWVVSMDANLRALPGADILLRGPLRIGPDWARALPNIRLGGPVPPEEVPELLAESDVGIIPFRDTPLTRAIHPVKLYEYFAAGIPVVAADLEEIRRIASPAILARHEAEWVDAVRSALAGGKRPEYPAFAARHDWSRRFSDLMAFLEEPETGGGREILEGAR